MTLYVGVPTWVMTTNTGIKIDSEVEDYVKNQVTIFIELMKFRGFPFWCKLEYEGKLILDVKSKHYEPK